jgi:hypothetical protein
MKQAERITNAIIEVLFGEQTWISGTRPLSKSACGVCGAYVMQKDSESHARFHGALTQFGEEDDGRRFHDSGDFDEDHDERPRDPMPPDEEINDMAADYEQRAQTESEAYRLAHS